MLVLRTGLLEQLFMVSINKAFDKLCRTKNIYVIVAVIFVDSVCNFNENLHHHRHFPKQFSGIFKPISSSKRA